MASGFAHTLSSTCGYEDTGLIGSTSVVQLYRGISEISPTEGFAVILVFRAITIARARTSLLNDGYEGEEPVQNVSLASGSQVNY
ncbi:hypothetical protein LIPSTDRAFT_321646 [Lipomyces starkeyi NRRL Y-11557]|uniref:Uncharacterized protein n=1 Tax=Lipomyces starkeyi NRRL Y-11557 TaxID=675824 RepID=A0A1E3Q3I0_LIPST|nr:hypothetical protein LIPSTDRAFT_321646 [Lipomyces starkeyi NRRL Y-11557]